MKVGDLVKITRAGIGVPKGTIGLILKTHKQPRSHEPFNEFGWIYHDVQLYGLKNIRTVRRIPKELEVISESR